MLRRIKLWFYERRVDKLRLLNEAAASAASTDSKMDQGDYHSGPLGYSPNTAYPETQYGRMFKTDDEADSHDTGEDEYSNEGYWR